MKYFGDSFDVVKRFLLRTVAPDAQWAVLPMFTHDVEAHDVSAFESFLGAEVVDRDVLAPNADRSLHLRPLAHHRHVFIDPNTGISLKDVKGPEAINYVFASELVALCRQDVSRVLLVFDQSVPRGKERQATIKKLEHFGENGVHGLGYWSQVCFAVLSCSESICQAAKERLLTSHMPHFRVVEAGDVQSSLGW